MATRHTAGDARSADETKARAACPKCGLVGKKLCGFDDSGIPLPLDELQAAQAACENNPQHLAA